MSSTVWGVLRSGHLLAFTGVTPSDSPMETDPRADRVETPLPCHVFFFDVLCTDFSN